MEYIETSTETDLNITEVSIWIIINANESYITVAYLMPIHVVIDHAPYVYRLNNIIIKILLLSTA